MKLIDRVSSRQHKSLKIRAASAVRITQNNAVLARPEPMKLTARVNSSKIISQNRSRKLNSYIFNFDIAELWGKSKVKKKVAKTAIGIQNSLYEQLLLKKSDKMKVLFWNNETQFTQLPPIAVSVDFIMDQDMFWESGNKEERRVQTARINSQRNAGISEHLAAQWRILHKRYYVIWIIRKKHSWVKLHNFIIEHGLNLHALAFIKNKKNYTIDYSPLLRQLQKKRKNVDENDASFIKEGGDRQLMIFETVKMNLRDVAGYESYRGRVPVVLGKRMKVILLRVDSSSPGLDSVLAAVAKMRGEE